MVGQLRVSTITVEFHNQQSAVKGNDKGDTRRRINSSKLLWQTMEEDHEEHNATSYKELEEISMDTAIAAVFTGIYGSLRFKMEKEWHWRFFSVNIVSLYSQPALARVPLNTAVHRG